jgi:histidyl-tRNA synthetase
LLQQVGVSNFEIILNSVGCSKCRPAYLLKLRAELDNVKSDLCVDCQRRADSNPLRVLDCKVPADQPIIETLPTILDSLCAECAEHFETVKALVGDQGLMFAVNPRLVRGLDYYTRTTFEFTHGALGAQNSILGGGRYDGLAEQLGSRVPAPGIGFSIGQDRLMMSLDQQAETTNRSIIDVFVSPLGPAAVRYAAGLAHELRRMGVCVEVGADSKLKRSLELAHKLGARYTLIVGEQEMQSGQFLLKEMATGDQTSVSRPTLLSQFSSNTKHGI